MVYPELLEHFYDRFLNFYTSIRNQLLTNKDKNEVVIIVTHGNGIQPLLELGELGQSAKDKYVIGVGYCCLSILRKEEGDKKGGWKMLCFGDGTHVNTDTTEILPGD